MKRMCAMALALIALLFPAALAYENGDTGEEITRIQQGLIRAGLLFGEPDGIYGDYTRVAAQIYMTAWEIEESALSEHLSAFVNMGPYQAYLCSLSVSTDISRLQKKLAQAGYLDARSGEYDEATRSAEEAYRAEAGVPEVKKTLLALANVFAPMQKGDIGAEIALLQSLLIAHDFTFGIADGYFGDRTREAVITAQRAFGMEETGIADEALMKRLLEE